MRTIWFCAALALVILPGCVARRTVHIPSVAAAAVSGARVQVARAQVVAAARKEPELKAALQRADAALEEAAGGIAALQRETQAQTAAREKAEAARRFWRAWALRLGGVCGLLGVWIFRKPLMLVAGL